MKKLKNWDWLSFGFFVAALFCLLVSIPATAGMTRLTHPEADGGVGYILLMLVLELMAFGSKLAQRWVPSWHSTLERIAIALLMVVAVGNVASGWDAFVGQPLTGFWLAVRESSVYGFPIGSALVVGTLSALVPGGTYLFLTLFVKRQTELETLQTPEAAATRALEPVIAEVLKVEKLAELLLGLQPLLVQQPERAALPSTVGPVLPAAAREPVAVEGGLDQLLSVNGLTRQDALTLLQQYEITTAEDAYKGLRWLGKLPNELTLEAFAPLYAELTRVSASEKVCRDCGAPIAFSAQGPARKFAKNRGLEGYVCAVCRNK